MAHKDLKQNNYEALFDEEYFEKGTKSNYINYSDNERFRLAAFEIFSLFKPKRVLEIGCAKGFVVKHLRDLNVNTYGIDVSGYAISHAPEEVKSYVRKASALNIPFPNKYFDVVCSFDVLEHIPESDLKKVISECYRVGEKQYHHITTNPTKGDKDSTHVTIKPLSWWQEKLPGTVLVESKWERPPSFLYNFFIERGILARFGEIFIIASFVGFLLSKDFHSIIIAFWIGFIAALFRAIRQYIKPFLHKKPVG